MFAYCNNKPILWSDPYGCTGSSISFRINRKFINVSVESNPLFIGPPLEGLVGPYDELTKISTGRPEYESHHIVEKRFYAVPGIGVYQDNPNKAPSVILRKETHRGYTNSARDAFKYGTNYNTVDSNSVKQYYMTEYRGASWYDFIFSCFD